MTVIRQDDFIDSVADALQFISYYHPLDFVQAVNALADGNLVPVPGGVLVRDRKGAIVGAVGVTGDTSDNDEICAVAGIEAAGLTADTGG